MPRYCAFYGSINVGGNRLKMADLRYVLEREDFENVETVVASGNVLFDYDDRPTDGLEEMLAWIMREHFDIESFVAVRSPAEVREAIEGNPFRGESEDKFVHTHFLGGQPDEATFRSMLAIYSERGPERMALGPRSLYVDYVQGAGNTKLTGPFIERRLGVAHTARNMSSLARILDKM